MTNVAFELFDLRDDPAALRVAQLRRLATMLRRCLDRHPYYRRRLPASLVDRCADGDETALWELPLTTKDDFVSDPEAFLLKGEAGDGEHVLWDIAYTGGTSSGQPASIYQTAYDFRSILFVQRRMAEIRGMHRGDRIVNLYPLTPHPHGAWMRCNHAAAAIGASVVTAMSGAATMGFPVGRRTDDVVDLTVESEPTVLWGVPSYVRRVLQHVSESGRRLPSLRMVAVSGEPCTPSMRAVIDELALAVSGRAVVVSDSLGASELQGGLVECRPGSGHHNPAPELFLFETLDDEGRPVLGEEGRLALTHLDRRGTVLLRYLVGDRVVLTGDPCPHCGRAGGRIVAHRGRDGTWTKIRGQLVDLREITAAVERVVPDCEYAVRIAGPSETRSSDELRVSIETDDDTIEERVVAAVRAAVGVRPRVVLLEPGQIDLGPGLKARRLVDERQMDS